MHTSIIAIHESHREHGVNQLYSYALVIPATHACTYAAYVLTKSWSCDEPAQVRCIVYELQKLLLVYSYILLLNA